MHSVTFRRKNVLHENRLRAEVPPQLAEAGGAALHVCAEG